MPEFVVSLPRRIDAIDRKILRVLQEDATLSVADIGERVGLSSTPCWKRIQRMEGEGIIIGKVALVDQNKIGLGLSVFVSVESDDHSDAWLKKFAEAVTAMPEVLENFTAWPATSTTCCALWSRTCRAMTSSTRNSSAPSH
jgi:Lrp/AsnC family transcriptional regulator